MSQPPNDQPTKNQQDQQVQPDVPTFYVSLRVTVDHARWSDIKDIVLKDEQYVVYPHKGSGGDNPHFHIFVPSPDKKAVERLRARVKRCFPDFSGNAYFSAKFQGNGILHAITYGSKEETTPFVSGPDMQNLVLMAPPWVHQERNIGAYMKKPMGREVNPDHFKLITPRNIERVTLRYRQHNGIKSDDLGDVLEAMHRDNWRLADCFHRNGIMRSTFESFKASCAGTHYWTSGKFHFLMREDYNHKN